VAPNKPGPIIRAERPDRFLSSVINGPDELLGSLRGDRVSRQSADRLLQRAGLPEASGWIAAARSPTAQAPGQRVRSILVEVRPFLDSPHRISRAPCPRSGRIELRHARPIGLAPMAFRPSRFPLDGRLTAVSRKAAVQDCAGVLN
jgi:hypothetical protein